MKAASSAPAGVLVVDKPVGPTSHDVVSRVRRALGTRRVGHTGTLDPMASGVLPVVVGPATRLARFLTATTKQYEAVVRFGHATDTCDHTGAPLPPPPGGYLPAPGIEAVARALAALASRTFDQTPPAYSAKKIEGVRAYALARAGRGVAPRAVPVTLHEATVVVFDGLDLHVRLRCSAGFYVRSLAHDLGQTLGCGGHLRALRRTASGWFTESMACALDDVERAPAEARGRLLPPVDLLPWAPIVRVTPAGVARLRHGHPVLPTDVAAIEPGDSRVAPPPGGLEVSRLVDPHGTLVAVATRAAGPDGALHPDIVLV